MASGSRAPVCHPGPSVRLHPSKEEGPSFVDTLCVLSQLSKNRQLPPIYVNSHFASVDTKIWKAQRYQIQSPDRGLPVSHRWSDTQAQAGPLAELLLAIKSWVLIVLTPDYSFIFSAGLLGWTEFTRDLISINRTTLFQNLFWNKCMFTGSFNNCTQSPVLFAQEVHFLKWVQLSFLMECR